MCVRELCADRKTVSGGMTIIEMCLFKVNKRLLCLAVHSSQRSQIMVEGEICWHGFNVCVRVCVMQYIITYNEACVTRSIHAHRTSVFACAYRTL